MAFDPNSAQPAAGFDPASAKPIGAPSFDPNTAKPEGSFAEKLGNDIQGGYNSAVMNGFAGLAARKLYEWSGYGMDKVQAAYPGQTDAWYAAKHKELIDQTIQQMRNEAADQASHGGAVEVKTPLGKFNPTQLASGLVGSADPTMLIPVPGVGGLAAKVGAKGLAATGVHIGGNAAAHAAYGSAVDAAYQGADIVDGLQKDFDWQRNLTAAAQMGVIGGLGGAYHVAKPGVSPFVKGLFKERGVDTLPAQDPRGVVTPLTGQGLNPEETAQYHSLLQTGNEQDIYNFFNDRNVSAPSHTDIHEWVQRRDAVNNGIAPSDYADEMFHPAPSPVDLRPAVQEYVERITKNWKNKPDIEIINHTDDIQDPEVRAQAKADNADDPDALGFYGKDGKVRVFANKLGEVNPEETLHAIIYHEALGHHGLSQQFGDSLDRVIKSLDANNVSQFKKAVDEWQKKNPDAYNGDRVRAGEEVLAEMSEKGVMKPSLMDALSGHVRRFGRAMGMDLKYNDAEVRNILAMAHKAVIAGPDRDVRGNGFRITNQGFGAHSDAGSPTSQNKFMFTGKRGTTFDPSSATAFTGPDGRIRNEISDHEARIIQPIRSGREYRLEEILHHPELYNEYPHMQDQKVVGVDTEGRLGGFYAPRTKTIGIDVHGNDRFGSVLHEVQHAVQHYEDHPNGATMAAGSDEYRRSLGEIEARSTEARRDMTHDERMYNDPYGSEGVHPDNMISTEPFKTRLQAAQETDNRFMRRSNMEPKDVAEEAYDRLNAAYTPSKRTWEQTKRLADDTPLSPEMVKESRAVGNLDRKLFVYDAAAKEANDKLREIHSRAVDGVLAPEDHAAAIETAAHFNYVLGRLENDARQIARGLNAMKAVRFSRNNLTALKAALEAEGTNMEALTDPEIMQKFLRRYFNMQDSGNPAGAGHMLSTVSKPYWWQYLLTFRQNMMLSGLSTHLKSTMDMATMAGREIQETALALPGSAVREGLRALGVNVKHGVHPTELAARLDGLIRAATEGKTWSDTANALGGKSIAPPRYANIADPHIPIVSKVTDLVSAQDTFFRSVLDNANLYALGTRKAYSELKSAGKGKVSWDDVRTKGAAYARAPTPELLEAARDMTENTILLNRSPINELIDKARVIRPNMTGSQQVGSFVVNLLTPFIRIGANALQNQIIRRSPLSFLDKKTRDDWAAGGARRDIAIARTLMGTALMVMYWNQSNSDSGKIKGDADSNYNKLQEKIAGGYSPNSVHDGNTYQKTSNLNISLNPFDTHNQIATMIAGMRQAYEEGRDTKNLATGVTLAFNHIMHGLANETFVNDLAPTIDALTDRHDTMGQKAAKVVGEQAKTFVPNLLTQTNNTFFDTSKRDVKSDNPLETAANVVKDAVPGLSQTLPRKQSVYGNEEETGATVQGMHVPWIGGNHTTETNDPAEKELSRLANLTTAAIVTPVQHTVNADGMKVRLNSAQFEEYQHYTGQTITQAVREQQQSGEWDKMSDKDKVIYVRDIQKQAKQEVRDALLQKEGWLTGEQLDNLRSQSSAKR
jgi:hypothetical protein